jgi:hypothetical protein
MNVKQLVEWELAGESKVLGNKKKPAPMPLCPPHIKYGMTWDRIQEADD